MHRALLSKQLSRTTEQMCMALPMQRKAQLRNGVATLFQTCFFGGLMSKDLSRMRFRGVHLAQGGTA